MSAPRQLEAQSEHYTALGIMNGVTLVTMIVADRATEASIAPSPDRFNPSSEPRRKQFAKRLAVPADRRSEVEALLGEIAVQYERAHWATASTSSEPATLHDEIELADRFVEQHSERYRYTEAWRQWSEYRDGVWRPERTLHVFDLIRNECRQVADAQSAPVNKSRIASAATIAAVEKIARARRAIAAPVELWDADPYLLNTPGGVVNLRTGEMRAARPEDHCRQMTAVAPNFDADCPKWRGFLEWAMSGDADRVGYLKRHYGMCLTGDISEHVILFEHGTGGNGKSLNGNVVTGVMGDYAVTAPMTTFTASKLEHHPTEIAFLRGARLVLASETEEGRHWNEQRLKELTGGTPITARFMRQDNFTFTPTFKPIFIGNHRPHFKHVDEAIRRRLHLVAFNATVTAEQRNTKLGEELREEWPAILAWLIEGCVEWQRDGLRPPTSVLDDTTEYLSAEDPFADWLGEQCERKEGAFTATGVLFEAWRSWAARHGEEPGTWRDLRERFIQRGFVMGRTKATRGVRDIRLQFPHPANAAAEAGDTW